MTQKGFPLALLGLMLLLASGCGSAPSSGTPTPAQTGPRSTLPAPPANPDVILATTTSTQDSGLLDLLIPLFERESGYRIKTIAVGSGQALAMGDRGEADVLLAHAPADERQLVAKGSVINRRLVMHNDFVLVGPASDPAGVRSAAGAAAALGRIAAANATFLSRKDDSGTHKKELSLWKAAGANPAGAWYLQTGSGMAQTLRIASEKNGYSLTDRSTYLTLKPTLALVILLEGDGPLLNPYHVMQVNPDRFSKVNAAGAQAFADFLLSQKAQEEIGRFGAEKFGQPLFFPDGGKTETELMGR